MLDEQVEVTPSPVQVDKLEELASKMEVMKREIDGLQISAMSAHTPEYRKPSTVISVLALAFSFGTTAVSLHRTSTQDTQASRQELRGLLQRLSAIPREGIEASKRYTADQQTADNLGRLYAQENALLVRQAAEIATHLPKGSVSATEFYTIAIAFQNAYSLEQAKSFLTLAVDNAEEFNDKIGALRSLANLSFAMQDYEGGRRLYRQALQIFDTEYPHFDSYTKVFTNEQTEVTWAYSEAGISNFPGAMQHISDAQTLVDPLPPTPGSDSMRAAIAAARQTIARGGGGPITAPSTSPSPLQSVPEVTSLPAVH